MLSKVAEFSSRNTLKVNLRKEKTGCVEYLHVFMHVCLTITIKEEAAKNLKGNRGVVCGMS